MYKCQNCDTKYDMSKAHRKYLSDNCPITGVCTTMILCPKCFSAHIIGGEMDYDEIEDKPIIMMFGYDLKHIQHTDFTDGIKTFLGVEASK